MIYHVRYAGDCCELRCRFTPRDKSGHIAYHIEIVLKLTSMKQYTFCIMDELHSDIHTDGFTMKYKFFVRYRDID